MPIKKKMKKKFIQIPVPEMKKEKNLTQESLERLCIEGNVVLSVPLEDMIGHEKDAAIIVEGQPGHYYRFLYAYCIKYKPMTILELGTSKGISSAVMADGSPEAQIFSVDLTHGPVMQKCRRDSIYYLTQDSRVPMNTEVELDLLFIDTNHDGKLVQEEIRIHSPKVKKGGLILLDDVRLTYGMDLWWSNYTPPENGKKFDLPIHGKAGFGAIIV